MVIEFATYKKRAQFGKPYFFANDGPTLVDSTISDKLIQKKFIERALVSKGTQESPVLAVHDANTFGAEYVDRGMNHDQGGWPKEINVMDEEAVFRFKKKLEREDNYIESMKLLTKPIEHAVLQNNAINIYEKYFDNETSNYSVSESISAITSIFRDVHDPPRPCSHLSWSPEGSECFAASYCHTNFQIIFPEEMSQSYIWNTALPGHYKAVLDSKSPIVNLEWNLKDRNFLVGGMYNGQIAFYDIRKGADPVEITPESIAHHGPVHSLLWIHSKTSADFFSTSTDGVVKWWDCRFLKNYLDSIVLDLSRNENIHKACSASCLEYDSTIPSKYLVGTDNGYVICGNRKGVTKIEKIQWMMKTHLGPVFALERNAYCSKFFLTVGDWSARIWTEECKESAVMWTKQYKTSLTGGAWSRSRFSVFFLTREDGCLDVWDFLAEQSQPVLSVKVSTEPLTCIRIEEKGQLAIVGDTMGRTFLIRFGESISTCLKNEKNLISNMFERENRREKTLESRMKELKLAMKMKAQQQDEEQKIEVRALLKEESLKQAEKNYWQEVNKLLYSEEELEETENVGLDEEESTLFLDESESFKFEFKESDDEESKFKETELN